MKHTKVGYGVRLVPRPLPPPGEISVDKVARNMTPKAWHTHVCLPWKHSLNYELGEKGPLIEHKFRQALWHDPGENNNKNETFADRVASEPRFPS